MPFHFHIHTEASLCALTRSISDTVLPQTLTDTHSGNTDIIFTQRFPIPLFAYFESVALPLYPISRPFDFRTPKTIISPSRDRPRLISIGTKTIHTRTVISHTPLPLRRSVLPLSPARPRVTIQRQSNTHSPNPLHKCAKPVHDSARFPYNWSKTITGHNTAPLQRRH